MSPGKRVTDTYCVIGPTLTEIEAARGAVLRHAAVTPLIRFGDNDAGGGIFLKLENLQPPGAFKIRPAAALLHSLSDAERAQGVWTASSGNWGIALAELAARLGVSSTVVVPDNTQESKLARLRQSKAQIRTVTADDWWEIILSRHCGGVDGVYLDAVADKRAQAGSGSIGLEIIEQLPDVDCVLIPFGGGGLLCGIAAALKAVNPRVRIIACESELATPLSNAFVAGKPVTRPVRNGFISGIGAPGVLPGMWPQLRESVDETAVAALADVAQAIRELALRHHVVAEGAGAVSLAVARAVPFQGQKRVCIISGGNIGMRELASAVSGGIPGAVAASL